MIEFIRKINKEAALAVAISLAIHILFFLSCEHIKVSGFVAMMRETARVFNVKSVQKEIETYVMRERSRDAGYIESIRFHSPESVKGVTGIDIDTDIEKMDVSMPEDLTNQPQEPSYDEPGPSDKGPIRSPDIEPVPAKLTSGILVKVDDIIDLEDIAGLDASREEDRGISEEFEAKMPSITPSPAGAMRHRKESADRYMYLSPGIVSSIGGGEIYAGLDEYLVVDITTYVDERDGRKYFRTGISAGRDADKLKSIPKEIVFLLDCSLSIQKRRLNELLLRLFVHYLVADWD